MKNRLRREFMLMPVFVDDPILDLSRFFLIRRYSVRMQRPKRHRSAGQRRPDDLRICVAPVGQMERHNSLPPTRRHHHARSGGGGTGSIRSFPCTGTRARSGVCGLGCPKQRRGTARECSGGCKSFARRRRRVDVTRMPRGYGRSVVWTRSSVHASGCFNPDVPLRDAWPMQVPVALGT